MTGNPVLEALRRHRVVAVVRQRDADSALAQVRTLLDAGLRVIEISLTTPGAWEAIERLVTLCAGRDDVTVGVGTVHTPDEVARAADLGAEFVISPTLSRPVIAAARERGIVAMPGCLTPTEMWQATQWGADAVKIFPASLWTPASLAGMLEALPSLRCIPTGGIAPGEVTEWLAAGALAVGMGSALTTLPPGPLPWTTG
ncbi:bifunctional 4-hydroxy-2-oxoglutarate aldolase/2-dehydro-3-deoxy-phosphogluconate aldolase [Dactylosporangium sp. NPDC000555]|uniref:bifunctional 4-hydroxy-2-oxoglutarate aldolase/2-dehydro-3-deoxy-phosphogluconate aldolase n=1 Tax=Dactylosporangium sp. NPDC000555 TaxID=3154260 RepID=UPI00332155CE